MASAHDQDPDDGDRPRGVVVTGFLFITFTLRAMLGVAETGLTPPPVDMF